jgi:hypothetical protein
MRTYQARLAVVDDAPRRAYAAIFSRALRSLHAARHSHRVVSKPRFMREFALTSRQYNAVKFTLDGMESSIVELRPGRIADLQQRIEAVDKKLAKLVDPKPAKTAKPKKKSGGAERVPSRYNCGSMAQPSAISRSMLRLPTASIICSPRSQRNKRCRTAFS